MNVWKEEEEENDLDKNNSGKVGILLLFLHLCAWGMETYYFAFLYKSLGTI